MVTKFGTIGKRPVFCYSLGMNLKSKLINKLHREFPEVKFKTAKLITKGWDHDVLVLDNKFIFRFAKEKLYKNSFLTRIFPL